MAINALAKRNEIQFCTTACVAQLRRRQQQTKIYYPVHNNRYSLIKDLPVANMDIHKMVNGIDVQNPANKLVNLRLITI